MSESKHTPGKWRVRTRLIAGEVVDCFVAADSFQGYPYDSEILGDDEYREGIGRRLADCHLIAAAPDLLAACQASADGVKGWQELIHAAIAKAQGAA
jgi:hypothetical protein